LASVESSQDLIMDSIGASLFRFLICDLNCIALKSEQ